MTLKLPNAMILAAGLLMAHAGGQLHAPASAQSATQTLDENTFIRIAERVLPSVVNITVGDRDRMNDDEMRQRYRDLFDYFNDPQSQGGLRPPMPFGESSGSGVLIRRTATKGYILTNNHVVDGPSADERPISVRFHLLEEGGTEYSRAVSVEGEHVRIVGRDQLSDLAVLEIDLVAELDEVIAIDFADSDQSRIGERILALGNPLDLTSTVTQGIISAKSRYLSANISLEKLLQTDAVIQPGNSGGPLVNLDGNIIGINNAIASRNGLWQGISFAIPSNDAKRISTELIEHGRVLRGFLGIEMANISQRSDIASLYGIADSEGVLVTKVVEDTPAELAGVIFGDVIRQIDGRSIRDSDDMLRVIANKPVDSQIELEMLRLDEGRKAYTFKTTAVLMERPQPNILRQISPPSGRFDGPMMIRDTEVLGMRLRSIGHPTVQIPIVSSLRIGGAAEVAGIQRNDLVLSVNGEAVKTADDVQVIVERDKAPWQFIIEREGREMTFTIEEQK